MLSVVGWKQFQCPNLLLKLLYIVVVIVVVEQTDKPVCRPEQKNSYGGAKGLTSEVECHVESKPGATNFRWAFNGTGELVDITSGYRTTADGSISVLRYTPRSEMDFGTLLCWAANPLGIQSQPCVYHFYAAGKLNLTFLFVCVCRCCNPATLSMSYHIRWGPCAYRLTTMRSVCGVGRLVSSVRDWQGVELSSRTGKLFKAQEKFPSLVCLYLILTLVLMIRSLYRCHWAVLRSWTNCLRTWKTKNSGDVGGLRETGLKIPLMVVDNATVQSPNGQPSSSSRKEEKLSTLSFNDWRLFLACSGVPDPPRNCSISNQTLSSFEIDCAEGYDGGIPQHFKMHVFDIKTRALLANLTSSSPRFALHLGSATSVSSSATPGVDETPRTHSWRSSSNNANSIIVVDDVSSNKTTRRHSSNNNPAAGNNNIGVFFGSIAVIPPVGTLLQVTAVNAHGVSESVFIEATQQAVVGLLPAEMQAGGGASFSNFEFTPTLGILIGIVATGILMIVTLIAALRFRQRNKKNTQHHHVQQQQPALIKDKDRDMDSYNGNEYIELGTKDPDVIAQDKLGNSS